MLVAGQINLMGSQGLSDVDRLRDLFEAFQRKRDLLLLLESCAGPRACACSSARNRASRALDGCSLVTAPYGVEGRVLGVLGVIGPTRMAYQRVIPVVQATAQIISGALNQAQPAHITGVGYNGRVAGGRSNAPMPAIACGAAERWKTRIHKPARSGTRRIEH